MNYGHKTPTTSYTRSTSSIYSNRWGFFLSLIKKNVNLKASIKCYVALFVFFLWQIGVELAITKIAVDEISDGAMVSEANPSEQQILDRAEWSYVCSTFLYGKQSTSDIIYSIDVTLTRCSWYITVCRGVHGTHRNIWSLLPIDGCSWSRSLWLLFHFVRVCLCRQ